MAKVYPYKNEQLGTYLYVFFCPGCKYDHPFAVRQYRDGGNPVWKFNGDVDKPTFSPSLLVFKDDPSKRCHSIVTDGKIKFCNDSFHSLKGQTVEMPEYES